MVHIERDVGSWKARTFGTFLGRVGRLQWLRILDKTERREAYKRMSEAYMTELQQRGAGTTGEANDGPKVALVTGATGITV